MDFTLETERLKLVAVSAALAQAEIDGSLDARLGAQIPDEWPPEDLDGIAVVFRALLKQEPTLRGFLGWYFILREPQPVLVGMGGFKGHPDEAGFVEIGYAILPQHQRQGYAVEAVCALLQWAKGFDDVLGVWAYTKPENEASRKVLERGCFEIAGTAVRDSELMNAYVCTWSR